MIDIGRKMLAREIGQLLHAVVRSDEFQKAAVCFKVALLCLKTPLPIVPEQLLGLFVKCLISIADKGSSF